MMSNTLPSPGSGPFFIYTLGFSSPPRLGKKIGVLGTRSPHRPNPVGLTMVKVSVSWERGKEGEKERERGVEGRGAGGGALIEQPVINTMQRLAGSNYFRRWLQPSFFGLIGGVEKFARGGHTKRNAVVGKVVERAKYATKYQ